jgi:hypothetical protein
MDGKRFDHLTQQFASSLSRRSLLKSVAGAAVAAGLGIRRPSHADAATCKAAGQVCREHANCCSGSCGAKDRTGRRTCTCPSSTTNCGGACVTLETDATHCGACGNKCRPRSACETATCVNGTCQYGFKPAGTVCHASTGECDPTATCTGTSADCPYDPSAFHGRPCNGNGSGNTPPNPCGYLCHQNVCRIPWERCSPPTTTRPPG